MKIYSIRNKTTIYGYLFVNEKMDDCYIETIKSNEIDIKTKERMNNHILDFIYSNDNLIVFFNNNTKIFKIENNQNKPFLSPFGNEIIFDNKYIYDYLEINKKGIEISLSYNDLINYINDNIITSKEVTEEYGFSRQYLNKIKQNKDIKILANNLYIKNNIKLIEK